MSRRARPVVLIVAIVSWAVLAGEEFVSVGDFSKSEDGWGLSLGEEFPGATGSLARDEACRREGAASLRLQGDFSRGGNYVAAEKSLPAVDAVEFVFWVKTSDVRRLNLRLVDATGQCHQRVGLPLAGTAGWQKLSVRVQDVCGGEHWGGANDGKWHAPVKLLAILLDRGALAESNKLAGTVWLNGIGARLRGKAPQQRTLPGFEQEIVLDDFEADSEAWGYVGGSEFPGAQGALARDTGAAKEGKASLKLHGDFSRGGVYVAMSRNLSALHLRDLKELHTWIRAENVGAITLRVTDGTGQCHQKKGIALADTNDWQELKLRVADIVGGEHWGGANDAKWHAPAIEFSLIIDKGNLVRKDRLDANLWLDDVRALVLLPGVNIRQEKLGNVFLESETPLFHIVTPAAIDTIVWAARDFRDVEIAKGEQTAKGDTPLSLKLGKRGYFVLNVTARKAGTDVDAAATPFAVLADLPAQTTTSPFGVCTHFGQWWSTEIIPLIVKAGFTDIRDEVYWGDVERDKGVFSFDEKHETYMKRLAEARLSPLVALAYGNRHYDGGNAPHSAEGFDGFARYASEIVKHYGSVRQVEVWNEWNSPGFCPGPADTKAGVYLELLKRTTAAVKRARPDVRVVGCSTTGLWWGGWTWLDRFLALGDTLNHMDAISIHPYYCERDPGYLPETCSRLNDMMKKTNAGAMRPIWVTEVGWPVNALTGPPDLPDQTYSDEAVRAAEALQAVYLVQTYVSLVASGVEKVYWYDFMNDGLDRRNGEHNFGMIRHPGDLRGAYTPKPAYVACGVMARELAGARFARQEETAESVRSYIFQKGGGEVRIAWAIRPVCLAVRATGTFTARALMGETREVAAANGECDLIVPVGEPVYLSGPVTKVDAGLTIAIPSVVRVAVGEEIVIPYELQNSFSFAVPGCLTVDGKEHPFQAEKSVKAKYAVVLPAAAEEEVKKLSCRIAVKGIPLATQTVEVWIENAVCVKVPPHVACPAAFDPAGNSTVALSVENISARSEYRSTTLKLELGDIKKETPCRWPLRPSAVQPVTMPDIPLEPYAPYPLRIELDLAEGRPCLYLGSISYNPCVKRTVAPAGKPDEVAGGNRWADLPAIDLPRHGRVKMTGYGGPADLGGTVQIAWDDEHFYLSARIVDDVFAQPFEDEKVWQGDSIQFAVSERPPWECGHGSGCTYYEVGLALTGDGPEVYLWNGARGEKPGKANGAACQIVRQGQTTLYEAAIALKSLPLFDPKAKTFGLSLLVNDNDGKGRKGWIEWGSGIGQGKNPALFNPCCLVGR